ncbi:MAG: hypothetical protein HOM21_11715 [Halobacteriovoraceae bacterium]|nr:hypothetical protein [Halobacteriovoraceae bacterium]
MKALGFAIFLSFSSSSLLASGNYSGKGGQPAIPAQQDPKITPVEYTPEERSLESIKVDILNLPRKGVAVHGVEISGNRFIVKGSYRLEKNYLLFLKGLEKISRYDLKLESKINHSTFAGITTINYRVSGLNQF